ncbi:serine/threonine-protein kinase [Streptomyces sporangiiformans]|uniref:Serine/threonine protein kinase n=1 Tax=Streptomyces sporangiiformans TaxID=2315329 RepID=A0A505DJ24_9ACTN|nr:serine/threonine-protein kinase [Streptomyces sporangiiformans]TPQ22085.1 serine/threonine protein kinase [Streptomyces sporangiiformans]
MQPLEVGEPTVVGPYRLLGRLGSGGMGRVYLGRSAGGRTVAVKIVHPHFALDEEFRARFRREVEAARRVGGAYTAPVLDADPDASVPWVATAYAAGPSLTAAVADAGPLPEHSVRVLGAGLAEALTAVHGLGLVHRDVKPSNVLLTLDGPLLIDFGIARASDGTASLTSTGVSIGSPGYMSPEQILGKGVTGAADVFSLGAVLAYAATGEPPFRGDSSAALLYKVVHEEPELDSLAGELRDVVADCLSKDPDGRPSPTALAARLAPEGAARLVAAGWLPGPLVEQVSRSAVQLLNLEAVGAAGTGEAAPSGVVGFSSPAVTGDAAVDGSAPVGVFGPPDPSYAPTYVPEPREADGPAAGSGPGSAPAPVSDSAPASDSGSVSDSGSAPAPAPGKLSVSVAATSVPGANGRGRRLSCTVALAVAGALATVTIGSAFMFDLLPGGGSNGPEASDDTATRPSTSASSSSDDPAAGEPTVPQSYLGTWEGDGVALKGTLPMGTFRVTVRQAAVGEEFGTFRQTDLIGGHCDAVLILKKATPKQLVATSVAEKSDDAVCTAGRHEVRLTPVGGDLRYETDNSEAGDPVARMNKVK